MKKLYTLIALIGVGFTLSAQSFSIFDDRGIDVEGTKVTVNGVNSTSATHEEGALFTVTNISTGSVDSKVKRYELSFIPSTIDYYCYGTTCNSDINSGSSALWPTASDAEYYDVFPMPAQDAKVMATYIKPHMETGTALYRYVVYNSNDVNDSAYVDVEYIIANAVDVKETYNNLEMSLYPNPANEQSNLIFGGANTNALAVEVVDLLGKTILTLNNVNENERIPTSTMKNGIYFVNVRAEGRIVKTKKLVVRH